MRFAARFTRPLALFVVLAGLSLQGPVHAQEVSETHLEAARKALSALRATEPFDSIILGLAQSLKGQLYQKNPDMQPLISAVVDEKALEIASRRADLERESALIYARAFTEEQLNSIAQFYSSDAGKKLLEQGPEVTGLLIRAAEIWEVGISRDLAVEVAKQLEQEGAQVDDVAPAAPAQDAPEQKQ